MRSLILSNFRDSLIGAIDEFLTENFHKEPAKNIYDLGAFANTVQSLKSVIREAKDPLLMHINVLHFIDYNLAGLSGFLPWCNAFKLKSKLKLVFSDERYSILALTKSYLLEMNEIFLKNIEEKQAEIERLLKILGKIENKGKEEASSSNNSKIANSNFPSGNKSSFSEASHRKEFEWVVSINAELETQIQDLKAALETEKAKKSEFEVKYQEALVQIERQKDRIAELERNAAAQQPILQNQSAPKAPAAKPQRLARGVFGR